MEVETSCVPIFEKKIHLVLVKLHKPRQKKKKQPKHSSHRFEGKGTHVASGLETDSSVTAIIH